MGSLRERRLKRRVKFDQNESSSSKREIAEGSAVNDDDDSGSCGSPLLLTPPLDENAGVGHSAMSTAALNAQYRARKEQQKKDLVVR